MNLQHDKHVVDWQQAKGIQAWKQWKKENEIREEAKNYVVGQVAENLAKQTVERIHPNRFYFFRVTDDSGPITVEVIPEEIWRQHLDDKKGDQNE